MRAWGERLEALGYLYSYTSVQTSPEIDRFKWFENLVLESEMYFTPFEEFNDPFEGKIKLIYDDATEQQIRDFWTHRFAEEGRAPSAEDLARIEYFVAGAHDPAVHQKMQDDHEQEMAKLGVRCFSELADDLPMWGHYADSHRGVCLRFRVPLLITWEGCFHRPG